MALSRINAFLKRQPLLVSLVGNTVKTASADIITQKYLENKDELDLRRLSVFTSFGLVYLGGWQHYLFNNLFVRCEKIMTLAKYKPISQSIILTFLDLGVHTPLMYYPSFYMIKGSLEKQSVNNVIETYNENIKNDMIAMWKVWFPAQMINFMFCPIHLRMPFITTVSFGWTMILSLMRGNKKND
jgi:protein Mpv17